MRFERQLKEAGSGSIQLTIPIDLVKYMDLKSEDVVIIQDDNGKHGKFISFWKKE